MLRQGLLTAGTGTRFSLSPACAEPNRPVSGAEEVGAGLFPGVLPVGAPWG